MSIMFSWGLEQGFTFNYMAIFKPTNYLITGYFLLYIKQLSLKSFHFLICIKIKLIFNGFPGQELDFWRFSAEASLIHNVSVWNPKRSSRDQEWIRESEQLVIVISCYYRCRQDKASQGGNSPPLYLFSNEENLPIFVDVKDSFSLWQEP